MENKIKVVVYISNIHGEKAQPLIKRFKSCCEKALRILLPDIEVVSKDSKNADTCFHITPCFIGYVNDEPIPKHRLEESLEMMETYGLPITYSMMIDATSDTDPALLKLRQESGISHIDVLDDINAWKNLMKEFNNFIIEPILQKRKQICEVDKRGGKKN